MSDLNQRIGQAHSDLEKREADSRQLEERLCAIPGMNRFIPQRAYGAAVNVDAIKGSLSARSLINAHDVPLASYLGIQSGSARFTASLPRRHQQMQQQQWSAANSARHWPRFTSRSNQPTL